MNKIELEGRLLYSWDSNSEPDKVVQEIELDRDGSDKKDVIRLLLTDGQYRLVSGKDKAHAEGSIQVRGDGVIVVVSTIEALA